MMKTTKERISTRAQELMAEVDERLKSDDKDPQLIFNSWLVVKVAAMQLALEQMVRLGDEKMRIERS